MLENTLAGIVIYIAFVCPSLLYFGYLSLILFSLVFKPTEAKMDQFLAELKQPILFLYTGANGHVVFMMSYTQDKHRTLKSDLVKIATKGTKLTFLESTMLLITFILLCFPVGFALYIYTNSFLNSSLIYLRILSFLFTLIVLISVIRSLTFGLKLAKSTD
jgi:hypothetical protein